MLRKLFRKPLRTVEITGPSGQREVLSHDQYISKTIDERKTELERLRMGPAVPRRPDISFEDVIRLWIH